MPRGTSGPDGGRHDAQALFIGFAGAMGIMLAFAIILCVGVCIYLRRYEHDNIERRRFVKRNIPSKMYNSGGGAAEKKTATEESKQEIQEMALDPEDGDVCSICLAPFKDRDKISWSTNENCTHTFHKKCISDWLFKHTDCPLCREVFLCEKEERKIPLKLALWMTKKTGTIHPVPQYHQTRQVWKTTKTPLSPSFTSVKMRWP